MKKTVAIIYGWSEGPRHGKKLVRALSREGFEVIKNLHKADVILAHSGGCFLVPAQHKASVTFLVGLPHWPNRHPLKSVLEKIKKENPSRELARRTLLNTYYYFAKPLARSRMKKAWKLNKMPPASDAVILVRNSNDAFLHPEQSKLLAQNFGWEHVELPGGHDDIWQNPEPYIGLIKKHLS